MKQRYLVVPPDCVDGDRASLSGNDYHHVVRVLRLKAGAELNLTDGLGQLHRGTIRSIAKSRLEIAIRQSTTLPDPPLPRITLIVALARGTRTEWTLQKCTELGADEIRPVICERSVVRPRDAQQKHDRWQEILRQAARQCERLRLPRLWPPEPLSSALTDTSRAPGVCLIATPGATGGLDALDPQLQAEPSRIALAVGPEGGFSAAEEAAAAAAGFLPISLGPTILRAETAVVALLAIVAHLTGRLASAAPVAPSALGGPHERRDPP